MCRAGKSQRILGKRKENDYYIGTGLVKVFHMVKPVRSRHQFLFFSCKTAHYQQCFNRILSYPWRFNKLCTLLIAAFRSWLLASWRHRDDPQLLTKFTKTKPSSRTQKHCSEQLCSLPFTYLPFPFYFLPHKRIIFYDYNIFLSFHLFFRKKTRILQVDSLTCKRTQAGYSMFPTGFAMQVVGLQ